jgi:hypothetical protein
MELFEEDGGSMFIYFGKEVVSKDCIVEELASESYKRVDGDRYLLDEDVINRVKISNSQEQVTLSERMEELEEEVNMVSIDPVKRKGRQITAPRRFQDCYYF